MMHEREYMRTRNGSEGLPSDKEAEADNHPPLHVEDVAGWEKLPRSVSEALTGDDLDFNSHGVLTFLIGAVNWKTGVYRGTIRRLAEDVGWERSEDYLRKALVKLRTGGWIEYESKPGQRSAYVIRLGQRVKEGQRNPRAHRRTSDSGPPSQSEVSSDGPNGTKPASPDDESVPVVSQPQTHRPPQDGDRDGDVDGDRRRNELRIESDGECEGEKWLRDELRRLDGERA